MRSVLIYAFDYVNSDKLALQSAANDIQFIWTLATSKYQLSPDDIMIVGSIDLKGKMLPWRQRCFLDLDIDHYPTVEFFLKDTKQLLLYFTAHGTPEGKILYGSEDHQHTISELVPERFLHSAQTWIIADMCYSHLFTKICSPRGVRFYQHELSRDKLSKNPGNVVEHLESPSIFIPSSCEHPVAISTQRGSVFTIGVVRTLINDEAHFFDWLSEETYHSGTYNTLPFTPDLRILSPILMRDVSPLMSSFRET